MEKMNIESIFELARNYKGEDFEKDHTKEFAYAWRNGRVRELRKIIGGKLIQPHPVKYTKESLFELAEKCTDFEEFTYTHVRAYDYAKRNHFIGELKRIYELRDSMVELDGEEWRIVEGCKWIQVSTFGRIKSQDILVKWKYAKSGRIIVHSSLYGDTVINLWKEVMKFRYPDLELNRVWYKDGNNQNFILDNMYVEEGYLEAAINKGDKKPRGNSWHRKHNMRHINQDITVMHPIQLSFKEDVESLEVRMLRTELQKLLDFNNDLLDRTNKEIKQLKDENSRLKRSIELGINKEGRLR